MRLESPATKCSKRARRLWSHVKLASTGVIRELSTPETASYSQMTCRTVRVSGSEPFQSAAICGYRGISKT
eukprot:1848786-Pleurochrysis_carterae.AAC.1